MLNQSSWFIRISSAHVDLIRNLMIHFTSRQIVSDLVQSCHQITLSHFKTYRINCHFYESFHFMTIHSTCVVFLVVTAAHRKVVLTWAQIAIVILYSGIAHERQPNFRHPKKTKKNKKKQKRGILRLRLAYGRRSNKTSVIQIFH